MMHRLLARPARAARPSRRVLLAAAVAASLAPLGRLAAQATLPGAVVADPAHRREQCRLAAQTLSTGQPAPRLDWALGLIPWCPGDAGPALAARWRAADVDSAALQRLAGASERLSDRTLVDTVLAVAADPARTRLVRLVALTVLVPQVDSTAVVQLRDLTRPAERGRGVVGTRVDFAPRPGAAPVTAADRARVVAALARLGAADADPVVRAAAAQIAGALRSR